MDKIKALFKKYQDMILYVFFGGVTTVVNVVIFTLCNRMLGIDTLPSNIAAWIVAVLVAYLTNRVWVFHSEAKGAAEIVKEIIAFFAARVATLVVETILMWITVDNLHFDSIVMKVICNVIVIILNYVFSKLVVFRKKDK